MTTVSLYILYCLTEKDQPSYSAFFEFRKCLYTAYSFTLMPVNMVVQHTCHCHSKHIQTCQKCNRFHIVHKACCVNARALDKSQLALCPC